MSAACSGTITSSVDTGTEVSAGKLPTDAWIVWPSLPARKDTNFQAASCWRLLELIAHPLSGPPNALVGVPPALAAGKAADRNVESIVVETLFCAVSSPVLVIVAGVFHVPSAMKAALPSKKAVEASGYSLTATAPGAMIPPVKRERQASMPSTKRGSVHFSVPSIAR